MARSAALGLLLVSALSGAAVDPAPILKAGKELEAAGKYREAVAEYDKLVKAFPREANAFTARAWAKHLAGDDDGALADLELALARKPNDAVALGRRARINLALKLWDPAVADFTSIAQQDPNNARAQLDLANGLASAGRFSEALPAADKAVTLNPASDTGYNLRGVIRQRLGDLRGALADCESALKLTKDEKGVAALTKVRDRLAAQVAANPAPPSAAKPPPPPYADAAAPVAFGALDVNKLSGAQYNGAVSVAMEGMRLVLAPLSAGETVSFEKKWAPMFRYPSAENIAYLNRLNPLVQQFLVVRSQTAEAAAAYDKAAEEVRFAAAYENAEGTRTALVEAGRCLELLTDGKARMGEITAQIAQLGDPPNAAVAHRRRKAAHDEAVRVARRAAGLPDENTFLKVDFSRQTEGWAQSFDRLGIGKNRLSVNETILPGNERYAYVGPNDAAIAHKLQVYQRGHEASEFATAADQSVGFRYYGSDLVAMLGSAELRRGTGSIAVTVLLSHIPLEASEKPVKWTATSFAGYPALSSTEEIDMAAGTNSSDVPHVRVTQSFALDRGYAAQDYWVMVVASCEFTDPAPLRNVPGEVARWKESYPQLRDRMTRRLEDLVRSLNLEIVDSVPSTEPQRLQALQEYAQANPLRPISKEDEAKVTPWTDGYWALRAGCDPVNAAFLSGDQEYEVVRGLPPKEPLTPPYSTDKQSGNGAHTYFDEGKTVFSHTWTRPPARLAPGPFEFEVTAENTRQHKIVVKNSDGTTTESIAEQFASVWTDLRDVSGTELPATTATAHSDPSWGNHRRKDTARTKVIVRRPTNDGDGFWAGPTCIRLKVRFTGIDKTFRYESEVLYLYDWMWKLGPDNPAIPPSMLPASMSGVPNLPPPTAEDIAKAEAEAKWKKERIAEIRQNIVFLEKCLDREQEELGREADATRRASYEFRVLGLRSDIQAEQDLIKSLETGEIVHTRSAFDEYAVAQFVQQCQTEAREASQMVKAVVAANRLAAMLPPEEAAKTRAFIERQFTPKAVAAHDVKTARDVLQAVNNTVRGHFEGVAAKAEGEAAVAQFGMDAAENIKAGADAGMQVCSAFGGQPINYLYQAGTGYIEGGPVQALKAAGSAWSNKIDYAITAYDTYKKDGALSAGGAVLLKVAQNHAMEYIAGKFTGPVAADPGLRKPTLPEQFDAAKFKQEREWGEALVHDFQRAQAELAKAGGAGAAPEAIMKLQAAARDKAAAVASSLHAKNYLKYNADPAIGRAYDTHMGVVHAETDALVKQGFKERNWNADEWELMEFRNSASQGKPNMDRDVGLRERPLWQVDEHGVVLKGDDGRPLRNPDAWSTGPNGLPVPKPQLTKEGKPMTLDQWREEAQALYNQAYRKASGGRSAEIAMEGVTTSTHPEAYKDLMWLGQDKTLVSQAWAGQAADVTRYKAQHILNQGDPSAAYFTKLQEVARGTAKDMETKLVPLLKNVAPSSGGGLRPRSALSAEAITRAQAHWGEVHSVLQAFGRNELDPISATRRIRELTGGKSIPEVVDSMATLMESLVKGGRRR